MHGSLVVASNYGSASASTPVQIIKLVKPAPGQTQYFYASVDGPVKVDFTAIANEHVIYFHDSKNQSLHVIFTDGSQAIIAPFFDSIGVMPNLVFEMAPGQVLDGAEFTSQFPITTDQSVLPALIEGTLTSGADFSNSSVDDLPPFNLALLPPGEPPPLVVHDLPPIFAAGLPPLPPPPPTPPSPPLPPATNSNPFITAAVDDGHTTEDASPPMASGVIEFKDVDRGDTHSVSVIPDGQNYLGTFAVHLNNDATGGNVGQVTWTFSSEAATLQFLAEGQQLIQTYTVIIADGHGGTATQLVTVTIDGSNDAAVISGPVTGTVVEAGGVANGNLGTPTATGDLNSTDIDNPADAWTAVGTAAASASGFGSYTLTSSGVWTYTLDNSNATVQALKAGDTLIDTFTVATVDGTAQVVTITIDGANDTAVITGATTGTVVEAGGVNNGNLGTPTATGDLNSTDVDNPADAWTAVGTAAASANGFGTYTLTAAGVWTYTLDNSNATVQALNVGDTLTDTFTATTADGTSQVVTITIDGANDTAVITGATTGTVVEAGGVNNGNLGTPTATGDLNSTDVDNPADAWTAVGSPAPSAGGFGSYTLTAAGLWTYTLDNTKAAVEALKAGDTLTDTFTATTADGTAQVVTITIDGANDAAVITGPVTGTVVEAGGVNNGNLGTPTATGDLNSTDVDNPADTWTAVGTLTPGANGFGTYTLTAAGVWTYTLDNSNATVQALNVGQTLTDTFTATTADGTSQVVTITIDGANDTAVITGATTGTVVEAGGVNNGTPGTPTATGDLNSTDVDNPADAWTAVGTLTPGANGFGSYTLTAAGAWTYTLDNSNATVQALKAGDTLTDTFTATTADGTSLVVTITIDGANDAAVISGPVTGTVVEAGGVNNGNLGTPTATGDLNSTDVDNPADAWTAIGSPAPSASGFGSYTLTAAGLWTYTLDNSNATVQALKAGDTLTDTFTATTADGTSQVVTITIDGANDAAVITGPVTGTVVEAGGVNNGNLGTPTATGDLNSTDVDNPADTWTAVGSPAPSAGGFGSYTLTATGVWTYTLDNSNAAVQALNVGDTLIDTFTATTVDGTTQAVTVTINGTNDAAVITGETTGSVIEAGGVGSGIPGIPVAVGNLDATDVDNPPDDWTPVATPAPGVNGFGSYTLTAAGVWTYTLDNSNPTVQALKAGDTLTDTFTATTVDGTAQVVTITIHGTDDAAVISGDLTGTVLEAGGVANATPGIPTATGDLDAADVDNPPDWTPVGTLTPGTNGFGSYTLTAAGVWTYTLDNNNAAVQALNAGQTLTDTFTATTVDGTAQVVTITIDGANDAAVISGTVNGSVTEAGGVNNATPGTPTATGDLNSTDVDNPNDAWDTVGASLRGDTGFGTYTLTAAGVWTYTLDNTNAAVQALKAGDTLTDTFTATTVDGTAQVVTITIHGTDDAAVISGPVTGTVVEAGGIANATPGTPTATGDLNSTDVDNPADAWTAVGTAAASANGYGAYTLTAAGVWTYTLDNTNAAVQALNVGQTLTDTFTATTVDGTTQVVTVTIDGSNDAAVISGSVSGSVTEAGGVNNGNLGTPTATGDLNSTDVDNPNDAWDTVGASLRGDSGFGTYTLTAAGVWTYTLDNGNPAVQALKVGDTLTDTFTVATIDGTTQAVTITINGTNDAAVITGPVTGTVVEAGGVANGNLGTPTATGDLNSTDIDNPADAWTAVGTAAASASGFGSYTLTAAGAWTYTLDNSNATVQALNVGDTLTDTFTVATVDGTSQVVTITIDGANDTAVITGATTGTVVEAGGVNNGNLGTPTATGDLNSTDADNPNDAWDTVGASLRGDSGFGTYTLTAAGVWTYTLDNSNATVQALNAGDTLTDTFTATTADGTAQVVTITIHGTDDAAVITGNATGSVTEAGGIANATLGTPTATGDLNSTDVDNPADAWTAVGTAAASANGYGTYTLTAAGVWTYTLDNSNAVVQALNVGDTLTDTFTATTVDGTTQVVTVTINGANDAAVITGDITGSVVEAGGIANATPGTPTASGDLNASDVDNTNDAWDTVGASLRSDSGFGTYTLTAAGVWTYTLDNSNATVQALNVGQTLTDTFTATTADGTSQVVTITIDGANDTAVITGATTGTVVEAGGVNNGNLGTPTATGDLNSTDVDNPADAWTAVGTLTPGANGFGSYTLTAAGAWTYTLDNSNATVQALKAGDTLTDSFTATTADGTSLVVTITIDGANDAAVISGPVTGTVVEAGGVNNGNLGTPTATGDLNSTDVDNPADAWTAIGSPAPSASGFGSYTLTAAGLWTYTLDNSNATVQALKAGDTLTDTFTATTADGTSQVVTITIDGANDAAVITGPVTGTVVEAGGVNNGNLGTPTATGDLNSTDVDNPADTWTAVGSPAPSAGGFGSYTLTATGVWTYTLDNSNAAVQALNVGDTLIDTFTATTVDGTTQAVTVTINGTNDAAVITGETTGSVIEAGGVGSGIPGIPVAVGNLDATDVDNPPDDWTPVATPAPGVNGFGSYTLTAAGVWTYTLDNSNPTVQALKAGDTLTDTFTATTVDGTAQVVTITIHGTDDAAVISGDLTGTVLEAGGVANATPGIPTATGDLDAADVDNPPDWTPVGTLTPGTNGFGSYTLTAAGVWTYTLDNNNAAVQALNAGQTLTDTFTATTVDGTAQVVTITIDGANDAAVISGTVNGSVTEAGGVNNATPGTPTATGDLNSTDVDNPNDAWDTVGASLRGDTGFGTYTLTAAGVWTYTLDNTNAAVQALKAGDTLTDTFTATTVDGTAQVVTITIHGTDDAAVISGPVTGTVVEAGGIANATPGTPTATGDLNSTDVDNPADAWTAVGTAAASANGYGAYTLTAAGVWTYTLDNTNAAVQALNVGQTLTDTFTATTVDGTTQVVTVTIDGSNDAAVISGDTTGSVVGAGGIANATPGNSFVVGDLNSIDVDNTSDTWTAIETPTLSVNGYGTFTIDSAGLWVYILDNDNAAVQALNAGDTLTDTFTVATIDGTTQAVTITINGTNDAAVITGPVTGTVVEAGGVANGNLGTPTATGDLNSTDVDNTNDAWTAVNSLGATTNGFGSYTLTATGVWTYTLDNSNAAVQALNVGDSLTDRFIVTTIDGTAQVVTITIDGANDAAVITGDTTGSVLEAGGVANGAPGIPIATGHLNSIDVDNLDDAWDAVGTSLRGDSSLGTYTLTAAGVWTYTLDNGNPTVQALNAGQTLTDTFTAFTVDGTAQVVTITINGTNDTAVISGAASGSVTEAGGVANGTPGTPTVTGNLNSTDVDNLSDAWTAIGSPIAGANGFGSYTLTSSGVWTYTLDNSNAAVQALNVGDTLTDSFTATTVDGTAQVVTITINGANDAAVISGPASGTVTEAGGVANGTPGNPIASGDLNSTDVDNSDDTWDPIGTSLPTDNNFGTYTLTASGVWTYTLDNTNAVVQALNVGQTLTDSFVATTIDGTSQVITITINGANDAAVISGPVTGTVVEAGGVNNATPGTPIATGDLNSTDVDNTNDAWTAVSSPAVSASGFGSYTLTASGVWTYALNNSNAAVQALNVGDTLTDSFTVTTVDGTQQLVSITINGANDAAVISGVTSGAVVEAGGLANGTPGTPVATGNLNSLDGDNTSDAWTAVGTATASSNGYGTYTLSAAGLWVYTLDNSNAAVQALNAGQTLTDTFTVTTIDGTAQLVTITINGVNDTAVITGPATGTVTEAGGVNNDAPGTPTVTGNLNSTDVDNSNDAWTAVNSPAASANGFGSYTLTADGVWAYTLNNSNPAVQALNVGDTLIDTFTVATVDGTAQLVTVTINGANDAAVITGATTGSVIEEGGVGSGIPGIPVATGHLDASEVDNPPDDWTPVAIPTPSVNSYGTYTLTAAGVWTYTLDNSNPAVQALNVGQTLTDTFTATTVDGTPQVVTITIHGTDDAAVVSGDFAGTVLEAGGVNNETPGIPTATGDLDVADNDNPPDWTPVGTPTKGDNGFGSYTLTAAGVWTYTLDNNNATVQALNPDSILTDTFTARTVDGTPQLITITIHGANDTAVITGPVTGTVTEAGGVNNGTPGTPTATGDLNSTDVDNPNDAWEPDGTFLRGDSGFSTYTVTASGVWTYTLDNNNPAVQALNVGQTLTDTLTAITVDGTEQVVTITINGANDAAVISGVASGSVTEAGGINNGTPGAPTATGDLNSTDVDNPNDAWTAVSSSAVSAGGFGSYTLTATGVWTYTLNNSNTTVQALNVGQTLTDTFTATTVDGTAQLVTVTINGANDTAVITGPVTGTVTEAGGVNNGTPGTPTATGNLNSTDVDNPSDLWQPVGTLLRSDSGFSTYTLTAAGVWTYTLDNSNPAVQALNVGQTLTDTFTAFTVDGTAQVVTITINGANDAAVITGKATGSVIEAGGVNNGTPGAPTATGDLNSTDVDNTNDAWTAVNSSGATTNGFGSYTLTAAGVWTYTLNNSNATVEALNVGQTLTDTFTATTVDGTAQLVTITINGANDAAVISGPASGSVTEAGGVANGTPGNPSATGNLNSTDVDNPGDAWATVGTPLPTNNGYGSYTLTAAGVWTYTLNNSNAAVQALNAGQTLTDTFTATTVDGSAQLVTVTINGANDAAVISGVASGSVTEAGEINNGAPGTPTATGDLNAADVDNPSDAWTTVSSPAVSASGFGSYTLTAAGVWTYTLNNSNPAVQALNVGQTLTDTFIASTVDGTAKVVTITINGSNDTPVAAADNNAGDPVTESGVNPGNTPFAGDPSAAGNVLTNDTDVDSGDTKTVVAVNGEAPNVGKPLIGTYGTLTLLANGSWSYALDNADPDTNALAQGQTATDVFTYTMADASGATSSAPLTITITGTNDAPDIVIRSGDSANANLTETGAGLTTSGTITVRDPDLTDAVTASVTAVALSGTTGGLTAADVLGMLSVTPGSIAADPGDTNNLGWAFNSGAQAFNFLNSGDTLTLAYTVQATDGSASDAQTVTVTIAGTGGGPVANDDNLLVSNSTTVIIPWSALLANDSDPNATITGVTPLNGVTGGTIPVFNLGFAKILFFTTPDVSDLTGNTFTYTISDGAGTSTATVNVGVMHVDTSGNDNPDLSAQTYDFSYIVTGDGKDKFIDGPGTDNFFGGAGNDTYQFGFVGGGNDLINESILGGGGSDIIQIATPIGASFTDLNFQRVDADSDGSVDDLLITYNTHSITVINEFSATAADQVETMAFNGGNFGGYSLGTGPYTINATTGGDDIIAGTSGNDNLNGGSGGNDLIFAGAGNDTVDGGNGNDLLVGGAGNDTLFGGAGNDTYLFGLNDGIDTINENGGATRGGGNDQITIMANGADLSSLNFLDSVAGTGGNLVIDYNGQQITVINQFAAGANSTVETLTFFGGASYFGYDLGSGSWTLGSGVNSIIAGDSDANTLTGNAGRDLLFGNAGNDTITGGGGTDLLVGGAGNDTLTGGTGDDVLVGGTGNDILTGGGGNNHYVFAEAGPANSDVITDFSTKDVVDLSPLLDSHFGPADNPADFARVVQVGSNVMVQADQDGAANGQNFATVAVLSGYGTAGADLVHVLFGHTTHDMSA